MSELSTTDSFLGNDPLANVLVTTITPEDLDESGEFQGTEEDDFIRVAETPLSVPFTIFGLEGDDTLNGWIDHDTLYANEGNDSLLGLNGDDLLLGNLGNDHLDGGNGDDAVYGGQGDDTVIGDGGDDIVAGDAGVDILFGGVGNDLFVLGDRGLENADFINDFNPSGDVVFVNNVAILDELGLIATSGEIAQRLFPSVNRTIGDGTLIQVRVTGETVGFIENVLPEFLFPLNFRFPPLNL